jgi:hypothetical protein
MLLVYNQSCVIYSLVYHHKETRAFAKDKGHLRFYQLTRRSQTGQV